ncbi:MAG: UDP-N-acetylglucosamine 2-epimerase (non-hydrolyzing) [Deltaproteobacteria bacterium]|nr:UDP-N-acetylglucosamine 2-epimerase (non-hydrolyzing) [Deltaproteobacteria bacterium]
MNAPGKIVVFAGTRPEIIKVASVVRELKRRNLPGLQVHFCFTGQHLELALPFLKYFDIAPDSRLDLMVPGQSLGALTGRAATQVDEFLAKLPSVRATLVQGDTTTAFVAALTSFYHELPVGHIEAGLRTSQVREPFPEELNRRLITRMAAWHYAPTQRDYDVLLAEQIAPTRALITGNTGIDSLLWAAGQNQAPDNAQVKRLQGRRFVLVTCHRRENIGEPLKNIVSALSTLARRYANVEFLLPVHKNPNIAGVVREGLKGLSNFHLTEPLEYHDLVWAMKNAELLLSDSGGIQEEAASLAKPVLVLRNETERPDAVEYGTSILVGSTPSRITDVAGEFLAGGRKVVLKRAQPPYGDGRAAVKIVDHLIQALG